MDVVIKSSIKNVYKNVLGNNFIFFILQKNTVSVLCRRIVHQIVNSSCVFVKHHMIPPNKNETDFMYLSQI